MKDVRIEIVIKTEGKRLLLLVDRYSFHNNSELVNITSTVPFRLNGTLDTYCNSVGIRNSSIHSHRFFSLYNGPSSLIAKKSGFNNRRHLRVEHKSRLSFESKIFFDPRVRQVFP